MGSYRLSYLHYQSWPAELSGLLSLVDAKKRMAARNELSATKYPCTISPGKVSPGRIHMLVGHLTVLAGEVGALHQRAIVATAATAPVGAQHFCATVGAMDENMIMQDIENQK
jgi:hypothetical protein